MYDRALRYTIRTPRYCFSNWSFVLTNYTQHSLCWDTNSSSARQLVPNILWKLKGHYGVHNIHILSNISPVHILSSHSTKIHFDTTLPTALTFFKWHFPSGFHMNTLSLSPIHDTFFLIWSCEMRQIKTLLCAATVTASQPHGLEGFAVCSI